ncbi:hypothetical protein LJR030_001515 [Rhizobium sp. LjRoot30]|uniref:hypothetical protein n=1 Tax=Rhizobium sp. LjRoot30 TaxID=3342320 RepID=UPI003ED0AAAD
MAVTDFSDGPVAQLNLLRSIILSGWSTSLDHKISAVIIGRYYRKHNGARASLRFLEEGTGATRPNIIASVRRLVAHGAFAVKVEGKGTRPTEYALNFNFSSGIAHDTSASGIAHDTSCGIADDTSNPASGIAHDTKTYLHVPAYKAGLHEGRNFEAAPLAPPVLGLAASTADTASGDDFDEFWRAWPRKHGKKKAEAEWKKIVADARTVILAAQKWASHYDQAGTDKKWIPEPANWLRDERWDEDLPIIHIDAKGAAIAKSKANASASKRSLPAAVSSHSASPAKSEEPSRFGVSPDRLATGTIEKVEDYTYDADDGAKSLTVYYRTQTDELVEQFIIYESPDESEQRKGQAELQQLFAAVELDGATGAAELVGRKADLVLNESKVTSVSKPWVPGPKNPRNFPRWKDVVTNTPWGGWAKKLGTSTDEDEAA